MGYEELIVHEFDEKDFVPPVGQGCIAIEAATSLAADKMERIRNCLNEKISETCLLAERAFLKKLEGGCSIPAFGYAVLDGDELTLTAGLASLDGETILRTEQKATKDDYEGLGLRVAEYILNNGGKEMLDEIRRAQNLLT